ncbi:hypothetical protein FANTH_370 [Fusarium anthophilum]|uniref:F-box domain-containing protein n=1 Tax=Fusarium anthophilum TaxID=48485 RepID=A0A8H4ZYC6_9HYPO|nr:hypothetical protein FANTH_370 [Fusarium anthophilum]
MASQSWNARLDRQPTELLLDMSEYLDREAIKSLSCVNKRFRSLFLPAHSDRVNFTGDVSRITSSLVLLMREQPTFTKEPTYKYVTYVRFDLQPSRPIDLSTQIAGLVRRLLEQPKLEKVTVLSYDFYKLLETEAPQLERLAFMDFRGMPLVESNKPLIDRELTMSMSILHGIRDHFKDLECLVLGEILNPQWPWGHRRFRTMSDQTKLNTMQALVVRDLKKMPKLTHFAFVLSDDTVGGGPDYFDGIWQPWRNDIHNLDKDRWYKEFLGSILNSVSQLQQLSIRAGPSVYCRGIKSPGEDPGKDVLRITWDTNQGETGDEFDNFFVPSPRHNAI